MCPWDHELGLLMEHAKVESVPDSLRSCYRLSLRQWIFSAWLWTGCHGHTQERGFMFCHCMRLTWSFKLLNSVKFKYQLTTFVYRRNLVFAILLPVRLGYLLFCQTLRINWDDLVIGNWQKQRLQNKSKQFCFWEKSWVINYFLSYIFNLLLWTHFTN